MNEQLPDYIKNAIDSLDGSVVSKEAEILANVYKGLIMSAFQAGRDSAHKEMHEQRQKDLREELNKPPYL